jgi:hypothetical protein
MIDLFEQALDDLVPPFSDAPLNWRDVIARSDRQRPRRKPALRRHRRAVAPALVLVALLATPALGLARRRNPHR